MCLLLGLLQSDAEWDLVMEDAALLQMCPQIRFLFVWIVEFNAISDVSSFFDRHFESMSDDFVRDYALPPGPLIKAFVLRDIEKKLQDKNSDLSKWGLPQVSPDDLREIIRITGDATSDEPAVIRRQLTNHTEQASLAAVQCATLLPEQKLLYDAVMKAIGAPILLQQNDPRLFFLDAPGGTGKTYTMNTILAAVRGLAPGSIAVAMASSGIAATLLSLGATVHSTAKVNIMTNACSVSHQSATADLFRKAQLLVIDEAAMLNKAILESIDVMLRDVTGIPLPFGGKVVVLLGDFRQTLPVVTRGSRAQIVGACIKRSHLWTKFTKYRLTINMRAVNAVGQLSVKVLQDVHRQMSFQEFLMLLGDGNLPTQVYKDKWKDCIMMPAALCMDAGSTVRNLIDWVFPDFVSNCDRPDWIAKRVILCSKNSDVDSLNQMMYEKWPASSQRWECHSADALTGDEADAQSLLIPLEYLNSLRVSGLPPHILQLTKGMPVMLLRNLAHDLCNGTRLIVDRVINNRILMATIAGSNPPKMVAIPRVKLEPLDNGIAFPLITFTLHWSKHNVCVLNTLCILMSVQARFLFDFLGDSFQLIQLLQRQSTKPRDRPWTGLG